eukprot:4696747-Amphidinium_carterae.1
MTRTTTTRSTTKVHAYDNDCDSDRVHTPAPHTKVDQTTATRTPSSHTKVLHQHDIDHDVNSHPRPDHLATHTKVVPVPDSSSPGRDTTIDLPTHSTSRTSQFSHRPPASSQNWQQQRQQQDLREQSRSASVQIPPHCAIAQTGTAKTPRCSARHNSKPGNFSMTITCTSDAPNQEA